MNWWQVVLLNVGCWIALAGLIFFSLRRQMRLTDADRVWIWGDARLALIDDVLEEMGDRRPRFELFVVDWGEDAGDMRYRWTIYDADAHLLALKGHGDKPGVLQPFMLGNAATRGLAEAEAFSWLAEHHHQSVVL